MATATDTTATPGRDVRTPTPQELPNNLRSHICDGESQLTELSGLCSAATVLAQDVLGGKPGDFVSPTARDGLHAVIAVIVDRVRDLDSWWTQLHELGVVQPREKADG